MQRTPQERVFAPMAKSTIDFCNAADDAADASADVAAAWRVMDRWFWQAKACVVPLSEDEVAGPAATIASIELVRAIGRVRDAVHATLLERDSDAERLRQALGGEEPADNLIADIEATAAASQELLASTKFAADARLQQCLEQCEIAWRVLAARERQQLARLRREAKARASQPMPYERRLELLKVIDDRDDCEGAIDELFACYDPTGEHGIRGEAYEAVIDLVVHYVVLESRGRAGRLGHAWLELAPADVRPSVREWLDPDNDGVVTKAEAVAGLRKAVDDIESPRSMQHRTSLLKTFD